MPKKIYIKTVQSEDFSRIDIGDWVEGVGVIDTMWERDFIRRFGAMLIKYHKKSRC